MTKTLVAALVLSSFAAVSFAQGTDAASAPAPTKHSHMKKAKKAKHAASAAVNPQASTDKKGGN